MPDKQVQQAWREKVTLCAIILMVGGMVAFLTVGFSFLLCPTSQRQGAQTFVRYGDEGSQGKTRRLDLLNVRVRLCALVCSWRTSAKGEVAEKSGGDFFLHSSFGDI